MCSGISFSVLYGCTIRSMRKLGLFLRICSTLFFSILLLFYKKKSVILCHNQRRSATCRRLFVGSQIQLCACRKTEISTYSVYSLFSHTFVYFCSVAALLHEPDYEMHLTLKYMHTTCFAVCFKILLLKSTVKWIAQSHNCCCVSQVFQHGPASFCTPLPSHVGAQPCSLINTLSVKVKDRGLLKIQIKLTD